MPLGSILDFALRYTRIGLRSLRRGWTVRFRPLHARASDAGRRFDATASPRYIASVSLDLTHVRPISDSLPFSLSLSLSLSLCRSSCAHPLGQSGFPRCTRARVSSARVRLSAPPPTVASADVRADEQKPTGCRNVTPIEMPARDSSLRASDLEMLAVRYCVFTLYVPAFG